MTVRVPWWLMFLLNYQSLTPTNVLQTTCKVATEINILSFMCDNNYKTTELCI